MNTRIAILGTPSRPDVEWSSADVDELVAAGFTGVQLNIAWSYRPADEPLNLEDVVTVQGAPSSLADPERSGIRTTQLRERAELASSAGLRTLFHFGAPFQGRAGYAGDALPQCLLDPKTTHRYVDAVARLADAIPHLDDLLVYTYDQDAWLCSEFGGCDRCAGVPLHNRVPQFINALATAWRKVRPGGRVWWEPWELSAGQTFACIPRLDPDTVGLMLHGSIAEVITTIAADRFFVNAAALAAEHGIPVVGEAFLSSSNEEVEPWRRLPVPLVTLRQLRALESVAGVVGVKEYFGIVPSPYDVNLAAAALHFTRPDLGDDEILAEVAGSFGPAAVWLPDFWRTASRAYEMYPWDATWFARQLGRSQPLHELSAATVRGMQASASEWDTPAWRSTRGSVFMRTVNDEPHPWLLEDAGLRFDTAAAQMAEALRIFDEGTDGAEASGAVASTELAAQRSEAEGFVTRSTAYAAHIRETNLARVLRSPGLTPDRRDRLSAELLTLLRTDLENQERELRRGISAFAPGDAPPSALQLQERWIVAHRDDVEPLRRAIALLERDVDRFLATYLLPIPDAATAGQFSVTSR